MTNEILKAPKVNDRILSKWMETVSARLNTIAGAGASSDWAMSNVTETTVLDADSTTLAEVADVLATLIEALIEQEILKE